MTNILMNEIKTNEQIFKGKLFLIVKQKDKTEIVFRSAKKITRHFFYPANKSLRIFNTNVMADR